MLSCSSSVDDAPAGSSGADATTSSTTSGAETTSDGPSDGNGDGIVCASFEDASACNDAQAQGGLQACAWVDVVTYDDAQTSCASAVQESCVEMNLSGALGCAGWSCLADTPAGNIFFRELGGDGAEVIAGGFCGNEPLDFVSCASGTRSPACDCFCGDGLPDACRFEPTGDECRAAFAAYCEEFSDAQTCADAIVLPGSGTDREIRCSWVSPTRWLLDGDTCQSQAESPRCLAGDFVGEGGAGCEPRWDPNDGGEGALIGSSDDCAAPYQWSPCSIGAVPPECNCAS